MELPHRFVPTTSKFVSPVKIVSQYGHSSGISSVAFSPDARFFASADREGWVRIWSLETLDVLGIYRIPFECRSISWESTNAIVCRSEHDVRRIELNQDAEDVVAAERDVSDNVIRLIGEPEAERDGDHLVIRCGEMRFEHEISGLLDFAMDPCERYVAVVSQSAILAFDTYHDDCLLRLDAPNEHAWCGLHMFCRGSYFTALLDDGSVYQFDAIEKKSTCLYRISDRVTAWDFSRNELLIYGNERGILTIYDIANRALLLRTPRAPIAFSAVFPSPEKTGFVALRKESATAFLNQSQEILSASPLPSPLCVACAGSRYAEVLAACADHGVYRLKLDENTIQKLGVLHGDVDVMTASGENVVLHEKSGQFAFLDGAKFTPIDVHLENVRALALSENGKNIAALTDTGIDVFERTGKQAARHFDVTQVAQMTFGKDKTAQTIVLFHRDLTLSAVEIQTGEKRELGRLCLENGVVLSVAPAAKSFVFVLVASEHGQLSILKVGLNSGKSTLALRVFVVGTQIWGAAESQDSVYLRNDATCLRIISGLKAFSVEDWSRSEPLALF